MKEVSVQLGSALFPGFERSLIARAGEVLADSLRNAGIAPVMHTYIRVRVDGAEVPAGEWETYKLEAGHLVNVDLVPAGTSQISNDQLRVLGGIASVVGGYLVEQALGLGGVPGFMVRAAVSVAGVWLTTTLIPPVNEETTAIPSVLSLRNQPRPGEAIPKIYGTRKVAPPSGALPFTEVAGNDQYLRAIFVLGYAPLKVRLDKMYFGDIPIAQIPDLEIEVSDGYEHFDKITLYSGNINEQFVDLDLRYAPTWRVNPITGEDIPNEADDAANYATSPKVAQLTTTPETQRISIDFTFPDGIGELTGETLYAHSIGLNIQYRPKGAGYDAWHDVPPPRARTVVTPRTAELTTDNLIGWISNVNTLLDLAIDQLEALSNLSLFSEIHFKASLLVEHVQVTLGLAKIRLLSWPGGQDAVLDATDALLQRMDTVLAEMRDDSDAHLAVDPDALAAFHLVFQWEGILDDLLGMLGYRRVGAPDKIMEKLRVYRQLIDRMQTFAAIFGNLAPDGFMFDNRDQVRGVIRRNISWPVHEGEYEVRIRKSTPDQSGDFLDSVHVTAFRSIRAGVAVRPTALEKIAVVALRVKASEQIGGALDQFNCIVSSPLYYSNDGTDRLGPALVDSAGLDIARNPAWQLVDALTGAATKRPTDWEDRIDWPRILEFAAWCQTNSFHTDLVVDRRQTLQVVLDDICRPAKASPCVRDGKYSIVHDIPKDQSRAVITLRNTGGFNAAKVLADRPHALRVWCINPALDWADDSLMVYDDGYGDSGEILDVKVWVTASDDTLRVETQLLSTPRVTDTLTNERAGSGSFAWAVGTNADGSKYTLITNTSANIWGTQFARYQVEGRALAKTPEIVEDVKMPGLVDAPGYTENPYFTGQAYKIGRYLLKALEHRPEVFEVVQDWESLVYERGDQVDLQMDLVYWGIGSGRVTAAEQTETSPGSGQYYLTSVTIDEQVPMEAGTSYELKIRGANGAISPAQGLITVDGWNHTVEVNDRAPAIPFQVQPGDLVYWGEIRNVTVPCLVREISHQRDLSAIVTLIQASPLIHQAENGPIPPYNPQITHVPDPQVLAPPRPLIESIATDESVIFQYPGGALESRIQLTLSYQESQNTQALSSIAVVDLEYRPAIVAAQWIEAGNFSGQASTVFVRGVVDAQRYDVRVRSRTRGGIASGWTYALNIPVIGKQTPPPDVRRVELIRDNLFWSYRPPIDFAGFQVRAYNGDGLSWEVAGPMHEGLITETSFRIEHFGQGNRTFLIKAFDVAGNESKTAAFVSEPREPSVDLMRVYLNSHAAFTWPGTKTNLTVNGSNQLVVGAGNKDTFYYDLGGSPYQDSADPAYSTSYKEGIYEFSFTPGANDDGHELEIDIDISAEKWRLDVKTEDPDLWPADLNDDLWPGSLADDFWPSTMQWAVMNSRLRLEYGRTYSFRVVIYPANTQGVITEVAEEGYAERISEFLSETAIANPPAAIYLQRTYSVLTSVVATVVKNTGTPNAVRVEIQNNFKGIFSDRIYVAAYDAAGVLCTGTADIYVEGY